MPKPFPPSSFSCALVAGNMASWRCPRSGPRAVPHHNGFTTHSEEPKRSALPEPANLSRALYVSSSWLPISDALGLPPRTSHVHVTAAFHHLVVRLAAESMITPPRMCPHLVGQRAGDDASLHVRRTLRAQEGLALLQGGSTSSSVPLYRPSRKAMMTAQSNARFVRAVCSILLHERAHGFKATATLHTTMCTTCRKGYSVMWSNMSKAWEFVHLRTVCCKRGIHIII